MISSPASQDWVFWTRLLFLIELIIDEVSRRIKFVLILLVVGDYFVVLVMVMHTCSDCVLVWVMAIDDV